MFFVCSVKARRTKTADFAHLTRSWTRWSAGSGGSWAS
jgi:hypothetical protein